MGNESVNHITGIRLRINGTGSLYSSLESTSPNYADSGDTVQESQDLEPIVLGVNPNREMLRLANFNQQRTLLKLETTGQGAFFTCSRILIFIKPIWNEYPG